MSELRKLEFVEVYQFFKDATEKRLLLIDEYSQVIVVFEEVIKNAQFNIVDAASGEFHSGWSVFSAFDDYILCGSTIFLLDKNKALRIRTYRAIDELEILKQ